MRQLHCHTRQGGCRPVRPSSHRWRRSFRARLSWFVPFSIALCVCVLTVVFCPRPGGFGCAAASAANSATFLDGFEDLPLMPGLVQQPGSLTTFESPYGRIVESYATGSVSPQRIIAFYSATLPQLGWQTEAQATTPEGSGMRFRREGEQLSLDITANDRGVTVHFQVSPQ